MIEAQIAAKELKHAISVMRRINDEGIFKIDANGMSCRIVDAANAMAAQVTLPSDAFDFYKADKMIVGVDLDKLAGKILKRAAAKDIINISGETDAWQFMRDIHQKTMSLLNPEKLQKMPDRHNILHTVSIRLPGKIFKDIVAEAADVSDHVLIQATADGLTIEAESNDTKPDRYKCTLPDDMVTRYKDTPDCRLCVAKCTQEGLPDVRSLYTTDYLQDIAAGMKATDDMQFRFTTDLPCEIEYERDGVAVWFMLAPRIESE